MKPNSGYITCSPEEFETAQALRRILVRLLDKLGCVREHLRNNHPVIANEYVIICEKLVCEASGGLLDAFPEIEP